MNTNYSFEFVEDHSTRPLQVYHGVEVARLRFDRDLAGRAAVFEIDLEKPETASWRHYYRDDELNELARMFKFVFLFSLNQERATNAAIGRSIYIQPLYQEGSEYSVCFTYDELSVGQYKYWLIGIARRNVGREEFESRVRQIVKYWSK